MPLLSRTDLNRLEQAIRVCDCGQVVKRDYCREDDEFFERGHTTACPFRRTEDSHMHHRSYRHPQPPFDIKPLENWEVTG